MSGREGIRKVGGRIPQALEKHGFTVEISNDKSWELVVIEGPGKRRG